jgi:superfamily I DNA/RNA helicase
VPNLIWTTAAEPAQLEGYERIAFDTLLREVVVRDGGARTTLATPAAAWLSRVRAAPALAVLGVRLRSVEDLAALHGYVLEPVWRAGTRLLVESDRKLTELDFDDPWCTLDRALHAAGQIWRPDPAPRVVAPADAGGLDAEQLRAVRAPIGTLQVIAPAGSGKTTVLIERIRELLRRGAGADRILATTFNRDAGAELSARLQRAGVRGVEARTFHSLGRLLLHEEGLARPGGVRQLSLNQFKRLCALAQRDTGTWVSPADARAAISDIKLGRMQTAREYRRDADDETVARIYTRYEAEQDFDDFDDLVLRAVRALRGDRALRARWQARFEHVLVDEYQDIEPAQELLVRILAAPQDALLAVGDDDQTLYGFRRASVRRMLDLDLAYPGLQRVSLAHNYRCPPAVVEASRALIDRNAVRFPKRIEPAPHRTGSAIELHEPATAAAGAARIAADLTRRRRGDVVVLARTTNLLRTVALACADAGVRISAPPGVFDPTGARMALEAHLRLCGSPPHARPDDITTAFRTPNRGLPYQAEGHLAELLSAGLSFTEACAALGSDRVQGAGRTLDALAAIRDAQRFIRYLRGRGGLDAYFAEHEDAFGGTEQIELEVLEQSEDEAEGLTVAEYLALLERRTDALHEVRDDEHGIELTTIHRAKGRQWPRVELFACEEGQLPHRRALDVTAAERAAGEGEEAERRLAYVAFTRAQETLAITATVTAPSRFLTEANLQPQRPYQPPAMRTRVVAGGAASRGVGAGRAAAASSPRAPAHPDPIVARALRRGLVPALRGALDRSAALNAAATAIEDKLVGERTRSQTMTVGELLDALRTDAITDIRPTAIVARLNPGAQRTLARALRELAQSS